MSELRLTPARRALLEAVQRGEVNHFEPFHTRRASYDILWPADGPRRRVTAEITKLTTAGWVRSGGWRKPYVLTKVGAALLADGKSADA